MRLWKLSVLLIWGLIACTPQQTTLPPLPTGSPVNLVFDNTDISLYSVVGWQSYTADDNILLTKTIEPQHELIINVWLPEIEIDESSDFSATVDDIAFTIEREQNVRVSAPIATQWGDYPAEYFLLVNDNPKPSMIVLVQLADDTVVALNIRGIVSDFSIIRDDLAELFETFIVNDIVLGNEIFTEFPDMLQLPSVGAEAALDPSAEPDN